MHSPLPAFKSSPLRALQATIQSPQWLMNLVWLTVAALLNGVFVGQIGLFGYGSEMMRQRAGRPENTVPDVDSDKLGEYISEGIWPFLVTLVVQLVLMFVLLVPAAVLIAIGMAAAAATGGEELIPLALFALGLPILVLCSVLLGVLTTPFLIRSLVCQNFEASFDFGWAKNFVSIMFWEIFVSGLLYALLSLAVICGGTLLFCVGQFPAVGLVSGGWMHMLCQWYEIYLSRGGEPAPASDKAIVDATLA